MIETIKKLVIEDLENLVYFGIMKEKKRKAIEAEIKDGVFDNILNQMKEENPEEVGDIIISIHEERNNMKRKKSKIKIKSVNLNKTLNYNKEKSVSLN